MFNFVAMKSIVLNKRFMFSWILSSVVMFIISYIWHGVFLNDISHIHYPLGIYLISATFVYLTIGFVMTKLYSYPGIINLFRSFFARGLILGAGLGLLLYMMALVLGVTFTKSISMASIAVDVPWQMFEQVVGGLIISTVFTIIYEPLLLNRNEERL